MACLSLESQKGNASAAWDKISHVLRDVDNSLVKLGEVQDMLEQESLRARNNSHEDVKATDGVDLLLVAGTLRKTVGALTSNLKADLEIQKVLPMTIQNDFAPSKYRKISNGPTMVETGAESSGQLEKPCILHSGSRLSKMCAVEIQAGCLCRLSPLVWSRFIDCRCRLNPVVWSRLPDHLLGLVFARLSLPRLSVVPRLSKAWLATSKTPSFRGLCAASQCNSKLFGIIGFHYALEEYWLTACDLMNRHRWHYQELDKDQKGLPLEHRCMGNLFAHHSGLICYVSNVNHSVVICNPLTKLWKTVALSNHGQKVPVVVQLVRNAETGCYKVMLVWSDSRELGSFAADCYDSKTELWSTLHRDHVFGSQSRVVFDCQQGILFDGNDHMPFRLAGQVISYAAVGNRMFVLHERSPPREYFSYYYVTEFAWENTTSTFSRRVKSHECWLPEAPDSYQLSLVASSGYVLLVANNGHSYEEVYQHQVLRLLDVDTGEWHDLPEVEITHDLPEVEITHDLPEVEITHDLPEVEITHDLPEVEITHDLPEVEITKRGEFSSAYGYPANMLRQDNFVEDTFMCDLRWDAFP